MVTGDVELAREQARERDGRFGEQAHTPPPSGGSEPSVSRGTLQFPEPAGFDGSVESFSEFFRSAEISDEILRDAVRVYADEVRKSLDAAAERARDYAENHSREVYDVVKAAAPGEGGLVAKQLSDEAAAKAIENEKKEWPGGPKLSALNARVVVRAGQMWRFQILVHEEHHPKLFAERFELANGHVLTLEQMIQTFRYGKWLHKAL